MMKFLPYLILFFATPTWAQADSLVNENVRQVDSCTIYAPNVPSYYFASVNNYDNVLCTYDYWGIESNCLFENFTLTIYNRWGEKLFTTTNQYQKWNSAGQKDDVFVWIITATTYNGNNFEMRGHITVLH